MVKAPKFFVSHPFSDLCTGSRLTNAGTFVAIFEGNSGGENRIWPCE